MTETQSNNLKTKNKKKKYKEQETRSREPTTALLFKAPKEDKICKLY